MCLLYRKSVNISTGSKYFCKFGFDFYASTAFFIPRRGWAAQRKQASRQAQRALLQKQPLYRYVPCAGAAERTTRPPALPRFCPAPPKAEIAPARGPGPGTIASSTGQQRRENSSAANSSVCLPTAEAAVRRVPAATACMCRTAPTAASTAHRPAWPPGRPPCAGVPSGHWHRQRPRPPLCPPERLLYRRRLTLAYFCSAAVRRLLCTARASAFKHAAHRIRFAVQPSPGLSASSAPQSCRPARWIPCNQLWRSSAEEAYRIKRGSMPVVLHAAHSASDGLLLRWQSPAVQPRMGRPLHCSACPGILPGRSFDNAAPVAVPQGNAAQVAARDAGYGSRTANANW